MHTYINYQCHINTTFSIGTCAIQFGIHNIDTMYIIILYCIVNRIFKKAHSKYGAISVPLCREKQIAKCSALMDVLQSM